MAREQVNQVRNTFRNSAKKRNKTKKKLSRCPCSEMRLCNNDSNELYSVASIAGSGAACPKQ